ncbi:branched-chain amino acid ABC transporter permease [Mesorhizobium sp. Z1-4]|uniref:branched-chain amino acid ABC transporter permease n=1 Tax=Mesorhizobium sp. Z1-4 TaxID=2448478 RepID=UPI000FD89D9A|nr:branched-chain amino acid ABC transporter permease [Mesorhizobium sp. Z1-4]
MDFQIFFFLLEDGIANGAIYALLAVTMVLVFTTTRILFVAQGEFVTFSALTFASLQIGLVPQIIWLLGLLAVIAAAIEIYRAVSDKDFKSIPGTVGLYLVAPFAVIALTIWIAPLGAPMLVQAAVSVAIVTLLGPLVYRIAFQPVSSGSVRLLFVIAIALHFVFQGFGLLFFGAEGFRVDPMIDASFEVGSLIIKAQAILIVGTLALFTALLYVFFGYTIPGKALRATAVNRVGARIVGIKPDLAGKLAFLLTAFIGGVSGVLIVSSTTIYYDSGLLIGLKSVLGAISGGMVSYPAAIIGSIGVGILEGFGAFWASAFTEAIVFSAFIPVLLWLSLRSTPNEEGHEL